MIGCGRCCGTTARSCWGSGHDGRWDSLSGDCVEEWAEELIEPGAERGPRGCRFTCGCPAASRARRCGACWKPRFVVEQYYRELERPIPGAPVAHPAAAVAPYSAELSQQVRLAHNDAFSTALGLDALAWQSFVGSRSFRPGASFVSTAADGRVLAYVLVRQWVPDEAGWTRRYPPGGPRPGAGASLSPCVAALDGWAGLHPGRPVGGSESAQGAGALYSLVHRVRTALGDRLVRQGRPRAPVSLWRLRAWSGARLVFGRRRNQLGRWGWPWHDGAVRLWQHRPGGERFRLCASRCGEAGRGPHC